ncbi:MAG TPA: hypothetical protein ENH91_06630 [Leeuwenhoekiella sp.]|nr:hypothetical protein [Leeuwenhoekiella sp.]
MDLSTAKYRITYEAFSKFSASISKAKNLDQLIAIVHKKSKYLFDSKLFRTIVCKEDIVHSFTFIPEQAVQQEGADTLYPYERKLLIDRIPFCNTLDTFLFDEFLSCDRVINPRLWGWHFQYNDLQVCVSVLSDDTKRFVSNDIEILHLVVDTVITKFQEIQFKSELKHKNKNLQEALLLIEKKNEQINQIVDNQKAIIEARTKEIRGKNDKLLEISKMNAHNVREPLSRILGIVDIIDHLSTEELHGEVLDYLKDSAQDLDLTLKQIIAMSAAEIDKFGLE